MRRDILTILQGLSDRQLHLLYSGLMLASLLLLPIEWHWPVEAVLLGLFLFAASSLYAARLRASSAARAVPWWEPPFSSPWYPLAVVTPLAVLALYPFRLAGLLGFVLPWLAMMLPSLAQYAAYRAAEKSMKPRQPDRS